MPTVQDIPLTSAWVNVYGERGIPSGTQAIVQNKTSNPLLLYVNSTPPTDDSGLYIVGNDFDMIEITPLVGEYLFAKSASGSGALAVQY